MNTPYHFLNATATVYPGIQYQGAAWEPKVNFGAANEATVPCRIFPVSSSESMKYLRETGRVGYKVLFAPVDSAGTAVAIDGASRVAIGGVTYNIDGDTVSREPGTQGNKLVRAFVFVET